jgi:hypothetical protein
MRPYLIPLLLIAPLSILALPSQASAGEFSLRIGGASFSTGGCYRDRDYVVVRRSHRSRRWTDHHRSSHRYRRHHRRRWPRVRDITPFPGHPRVYSVKPFPRHPRVIIVPQPYSPRGGGCWR